MDWVVEKRGSGKDFDTTHFDIQAHALLRTGF
jgi:hypothetical protein